MYSPYETYLIRDGCFINWLWDLEMCFVLFFCWSTSVCLVMSCLLNSIWLEHFSSFLRYSAHLMSFKSVLHIAKKQTHHIPGHSENWCYFQTAVVLFFFKFIVFPCLRPNVATHYLRVTLVGVGRVQSLLLFLEHDKELENGRCSSKAIFVLNASSWPFAFGISLWYCSFSCQHGALIVCE